MDAQKLSDAIENVGSGLAALSLIAISSQTYWPVPDFVMPGGIVKAGFVCAIIGAAVRIMSKPIAGLFSAFTTTQKETKSIPTDDVKP